MTIKEIKHESVITQKEKRTVVKKLRAAAYCRVSTLAESQEESFEVQEKYYKDLLGRNPDKILVKIYGDQGISGLQAGKRPEFMKMMADCRAGKIDEIYCRSISRFARNFADLIKYIEELRQYGVIVHFEKEHFSTDDRNMEIVLKAMAIVAQEESNSISQSISWAIEQGARAGKPKRRAAYGYDRDPKTQKWTLNTKEAENVRMIFDLYIKGEKLSSIARIMNEKGPYRDEKNWTRTIVRYMLTNEVYIGDVLTHKNYTLDYLTKKHKRNKGERAQYLIKGHHESIVDLETFNKANEKVKENADEHRKNHPKS